MLTLGIPKEILCEEKRVALTPEAVKSLCQAGAVVWIESNAGFGSGFTDKDYQLAGAFIASSPAELYEKARLIQKVKQPLPCEFSFLKSHHVLFAFLHLASHEQCDLVKALLQCKATAIGYETYRVANRLPILAPMSEIAGGLSVAYAACIQSFLPRGVVQTNLQNLLSSMKEAAACYPKVINAKLHGRIAIFGAGIAGRAALQMTQHWAGVQVTLFDENPEVVSALKAQGISASLFKDYPHQALQAFDVLIGAAHAPGQRAPLIFDEETLAYISRVRPKILIDIAVDQGGNFPLSRSTSYLEPIYWDPHKNIRFCVPNIPAWAGRYASQAISDASLPVTRQLIFNFDQAMTRDVPLREALNIQDGKILKPSIQSAHQQN